MLPAVGIPDGGISQPASGRRLKIAKIAAIARERASLDRMAFPLSCRRWGCPGLRKD